MKLCNASSSLLFSIVVLLGEGWGHGEEGSISLNSCKARGHGVKLQITAHQSGDLCTAVTGYPEKQCIVDFFIIFDTALEKWGWGGV